MNDKQQIIHSIKKSLERVQKLLLSEPPSFEIRKNSENLLEKMKFEWERNGAIFHVPQKNLADASKTIANYLNEKKECEYIAFSNCLNHLHHLIINQLREKTIVTEPHQMEKVNCSICLAKAGIAENGTILVHWDEQQSRSIALLPENVIYLLTIKNLFLTMDEAFQKLREQQISGWVMISGPSRTADIEKILVTGVHGPKFVSLLILDEEIYD